MAKLRKTWVYSPPKPPAPKVPVNVKTEAEQKARQLIEAELIPRYIKPPPKNDNFNYLIDIYTKWYRHYFYFCAKYCSPGLNTLSPDFETKFARLEYVGGNRFNLSFMRYTGDWIESYPNLSLDECLAAIKDDPFFSP